MAKVLKRPVKGYPEYSCRRPFDQFEKARKSFWEELSKAAAASNGENLEGVYFKVETTGGGRATYVVNSMKPLSVQWVPEGPEAHEKVEQMNLREIRVLAKATVEAEKATIVNTVLEEQVYTATPIDNMTVVATLGQHGITAHTTI